jgi:hypothetical protein
MALSVKIKKVNIKRNVITTNNTLDVDSYLITLNLILKDGGTSKLDLDFVCMYSNSSPISLKDFINNFRLHMQSIIDDYKSGNVDDIDTKLTAELINLENDLLL